MTENNRPAMLAATRALLDHIEAGRIETTFFTVQNSGVCAIDIGWRGGSNDLHLADQIRAVWPDGEEKLRWRARRNKKRAADQWSYVVDVEGCEVRVDFLKPHAHVSPTMSAAEKFWRCGSCGGRLTKAVAAELGAPEVTR